MVRSILNSSSMIKDREPKVEEPKVERMSGEESTAPYEPICTIPLAISNRHIHLSQSVADKLFGPGYRFNVLKDLSQPGQYAYKETVTLIGSKGIMEKVRILGPLRPDTQVEISMTDSFKLGVKPFVRDSGDVTGTPGINIAGPVGTARLDKGVIIARRHIHVRTDEARAAGLKDKELVNVLIKSARPLIFSDVLVRVSDKFATELHLDTDEGNSSAVKNGDFCQIIKI